MSPRGKRVLVVLGCAVTFGCASKPAVPEKWSDTMHEMAATMTDLYPMLFSDRDFNAKENEKRIEKDTEKLYSMSTQVRRLHDTGKAPADADPGMKSIAASFEKETATALQGLRENRRDYSRAALANTTALCMQCHTRGTNGPEFVHFEDFSNVPRMAPVERGELLTALRRYDQALETFHGVIDDPVAAKTSPFTWELAAKDALNIAVRVHQKSDEALLIVDTITKTSGAPVSIKSRALDWRKSILAWQKEKPVSSESQKLAAARKILDGAVQSRGLLDSEGSFVDFLRASALLHDFLRTDAKPADQAKAFFLLGQCYENIQTRRFWNLNEIYYKACIFKVPHSEQAVECYRRYEESEFLGALNSSQAAAGLSLVNDYMEYLKELAYP